LNCRIQDILEHRCRSHYAAAVGVGPDSAEAFLCDTIIPPVFGPNQMSEPAKSSHPSVLFIGAIGSRKRGELALAAASETRAHIPDLEFVVVGPPSDRPHYPDWVTFHSGLDEDSMRVLLASAWVLLAPSSYEGFGIPAWEAMSSSTAVLGTSNPGLDYVSANGTACRIHHPDDLGAELRVLLEDSRKRTELIHAGRRRAQQIAEAGSPKRYLQLFYRAVASS
jgi:glycosyltransferase involved in cell wall biosynthesis